MAQTDTAFETIPDDVFASLMEDTQPGQASSKDIQGGTKPAEVIPTPPAKTDPAKPIVKPEDTPPAKTAEEIEAANKVQLDEAAGEDVVLEGTPQGIDEAAFFKAKVQGLIERGIWQEFEGMEDFEYNEENYGKLVETQAEWKAEEKYEERVGKSGDIGKIIIDHIEKGGNPDDIIDLFKASKRIETFDIKTDTGKESLVKEYYNKVVGWSEAKTDKYVKTLIDAGGDRLTEEANDAKGLMEKGIQAQIKETQAQVALNQARQKEQAISWESNMKKIIKDRTDLSDTDKRDAEEAILKYNIKLQDGRVVNKFMVKFMEMQADPQKYIDLVRFVTNPDKYKAKVEKQVATTEAKKTWEFIKGNAALSNKTGTSHNTIESNKPKTDLVVDWRKINL